MIKKYSSIENSYREKFIEKWLTKYPSLKDELFVATEKIHGTNLGIEIKKDGSWRFQSRNNYVDGNFFKCVEFFEQENHLLGSIIHYGLDLIFEHSAERVVFYGEFFGDKIQKDVNYTDLFEVNGLKRNYKLFDIWVEGIGYLIYDMIDEDFFKKHFVKIIRKGTLQECLDIDVDNLQTSYGEGLAEGVVIRPFYSEYVWGTERFVLKKKSSKFAEKGKSKTKYVASPLVSKYSNLFDGYVNENRIQNVFSKYGEIKEKKQIGKYIGLVLEDAWQDFIKDNDVSILEKKEAKSVKKNVSKKVQQLLFKYL